MSNHTLQIKTERLLLDNITVGDASTIVKLSSNPAVYQYFTNPKKISLEEHLNWFNTCYLHDDSRFDFAAITYSNRDCIGIFGVKLIDDKTAEISYILSPEVQGKGYATEAICGLTDWLKRSTFDCTKLVATIHRNNGESIKVIKRLGYILEKEKDLFLFYSKPL